MLQSSPPVSSRNRGSKSGFQRHYVSVSPKTRQSLRNPQSLAGFSERFFGLATWGSPTSLTCTAQSPGILVLNPISKDANVCKTAIHSPSFDKTTGFDHRKITELPPRPAGDRQCRCPAVPLLELSGETAHGEPET